MRILAVILGFVLLGAPRAFSKAAYHGPDWMIREAEFIAIVNITEVRNHTARGTNWTYNEVANARVERVLKGRLPDDIILHGAETFICAQVSYKPGRHLVFLRRDGNLLAGINWHLGNRLIKGERVEWFSAPQTNCLVSAFKPLPDVTAGIEEQIKRGTTAKPRGQ